MGWENKDEIIFNKRSFEEYLDFIYYLLGNICVNVYSWSFNGILDRSLIN